MDRFVPNEMAKVCVITAKAMKSFRSCNTISDLLPMIDTVQGELGAWYDCLPEFARTPQLARTPWQDHALGIAYIHLGHLDGATLPMRRAFSMCNPGPDIPMSRLQPSEVSRLSIAFKDGVTAARQSAWVLHLFLGENRGVRHCWAIMYVQVYACLALSICLVLTL